MLIYNYFEGDNCKNNITDMQFQMYAYSISFMFAELKHVYLNNSYVALYLDNEKQEEINALESYDHRLMQTPHDLLAAVFRYKLQLGEFAIELFDNNNDELKNFYETKFKDSDFLTKIDHKLWIFTKKWLDFLKYALNNNYSICREISNSILLNNSNKEKAWIATNNSKIEIMKTYNQVPWTI